MTIMTMLMMSMSMTTTKMMGMTTTVFFPSRAARRQLQRKRGAGGADGPGCKAPAVTRRLHHCHGSHGRPYLPVSWWCRLLAFLCLDEHSLWRFLVTKIVCLRYKVYRK